MLKIIAIFTLNTVGACESAVVQAMCYKPEDRASIPGEVTEIFQLT
jgi:hypothetical protein